jgi:Na+/melibiose symporter-like transporter
MRSLGLNEVDIGLVSTVNLAFAFLCHLVASPVTNKIGRKKATVIFDTLSWSVPMVIWAASQNIWFFLAAGIVNATSKVTVVSWNCLVSEDEKREKVPKIFTIITLVNSAIGVFAPITGFFIAQFGLINSMRPLYAIGGISMAAMFISRHFFVRETEAGKKMMADHAGIPMKQSVAAYLKMVFGLYRNRKFALLAVIFITTNFINTLNVFQVIFLTERLKYAQNTISLIPFIVAVANILIFAFVVPRLSKKKPESVLSAFALGNLIASLLFLAIPEKNLGVMLAVMALNGMANFILLSYRESVFMNAQGEHEKADMYSAVQTLTILFVIPAGYAGGILYRVNPLFPFALVSILYAAAFAASIAFSRLAHTDGQNR